MTLWRTFWIVFALRVVNHSYVSHPTLGMMAAGALATNTRGVETDVGATSSAGIALPRPRVRRPKRFSLLKLLTNALAGGFGGSLDRRFTEPQARHLLQHALGPVGEAAQHTGHCSDFFGGWRQRRLAQPQFVAPWLTSLSATGTAQW